MGKYRELSEVKFQKLAAIAFLLVTVSASTLVMADGMPSTTKKEPQPLLTPLDHALDEIQGKAPTSLLVTPAEAAQPTAEELKTESPAPVAQVPPAPLPVPESRIVNVQPNTSFFGLSVGLYDITHGRNAVSFNVEWQPGVKIVGVLQPILGALVTTRGSMMGYGGVGVPFHVGRHYFIMPSFAVGGYHAGNGYDLDRTLAFRLGSEFAYEFDNKSRLGINAHMISNGRSMHAEDRTETISLVYTMPLNALSGEQDMSPAIQAEEPVQ